MTNESRPVTGDAPTVHERIGAIVQARMTSRRLPGKSLRPLCGKPLLQYVLESLARVRPLALVLVATSSDPTDDPIESFCDRLGTSCFRGPLENVAERFLGAALRHQLAGFVRASGDSPLLDSRLVARGVALFQESKADLATNVSPRTYPAGMSVEVVRTAAFERVVPGLDESDDREHVTRYLYRHPEQFRIVNFARDVACRDVRLAVDTPGDFELVERIVASMTRPHWEYSLDDVLGLCDALAVPAADATAPEVRP